MSRVFKMAEVEGEKCCLCFTEVYSGIMKSNRIRLDGGSAKKSRDVLDSCYLSQSQLPVSQKCRAKVEGLAALAEKIRCVEKELASAIGVVLEKAQPVHSKRSLPGSSVCLLALHQGRDRRIMRKFHQVVAIQPQEEADTNVVSVRYGVLYASA